MNIELLTIGKVRSGYLQAGTEDFQKRLQGFCKFSWKTLPTPSYPKNAKPSQALINQALESEKQIFQKELKKFQGITICLDRRGKPLSSEGFSEKIKNWQNEGQAHLAFLIGGPFGHHEDLLQEAHFNLSLSEMTFAHELCALIFLEQLYRATCILSGHPYHK